MNLQDVTRIIEAAERPLKLRFSRICNTSKETSTLPCMSPETADVSDKSSVQLYGVGAHNFPLLDFGTGSPHENS
jgi:hypothetical protein